MESATITKDVAERMLHQIRAANTLAGELRTFLENPDPAEALRAIGAALDRYQDAVNKG